MNKICVTFVVCIFFSYNDLKQFLVKKVLKAVKEVDSKALDQRGHANFL